MRILQVQGFLVAVFLCVVGALFFVLTHDPVESESTVDLEEKINPNSARVASLIRLPQIGLARARAITVYRENARIEAGDSNPFHCPDDLQRINGIGPKTVAGITDCLEFGSPDETASLEKPAILDSAK